MRGLRYLFFFGIVLSLFSCNKFKGSQEIPAYIKINPWTFTTDYQYEGAATHAITDAWIYIDGNLLGCFEMKSHDDGEYAMIPVLKQGNHTMQVYPGVKLNGISSTRIQYPFYKPCVYHHSFTPGVIETINPSTKYYSVDSTLVRFKMMEDFEEVNNIRLYRLDTTYADLVQISHRNNPNAWMDPYDTLNHYRSGYIHVGDSLKRFCVASDRLVGLPTLGNYVLLEMDYKCTEDFMIGMFIRTPQDGIMDKELIYLKKTDTWKKAYVNFSPTVTENYNASYLKFYFSGAVEGDRTADFYFDNIKLIYLD